MELELAGDPRTMEQIARTLSTAWGVPVTAPSMSLEEALAAGMPTWGAGHEWNNAVLQPARPEFARELDIPVTTFAEWADEQPAPVSGQCPASTPSTMGPASTARQRTRAGDSPVRSTRRGGRSQR